MIGRYILTPAIFDLLEHQQPGIGHDVGSQLGYVKAILSFAVKREDLRQHVLEFFNNIIDR